MAGRSAAQMAALKKAQEASARKRRNKAGVKSQHLGKSRARNKWQRDAVRGDFEDAGGRGRFKERKYRGSVGSLTWAKRESKAYGEKTADQKRAAAKQARKALSGRKTQRKRSIAAAKRRGKP